MLALLLRLWGHDAQAVTGGPEALDYLNGHTPAVVVLDVMMPQMSGLDVLRVIRSDGRLPHLPVVMYSAVGDEQTRREAADLGAQGYVVKGGGLRELRQLV